MPHPFVVERLGDINHWDTGFHATPSRGLRVLRIAEAWLHLDSEYLRGFRFWCLKPTTLTVTVTVTLWGDQRLDAAACEGSWLFDFLEGWYGPRIFQPYSQHEPAPTGEDRGRKR